MALVIFNPLEDTDVAVVQGKPFLFYCYRVDRHTIPDKYFVYDVADAEGDGCFARIQKHVLVNHWGTLIGKHEIELDEDGKYFPEEGSYEYRMDIVNYMNAEEYLEMPDEAIMDGAQMVD